MVLRYHAKDIKGKMISPIRESLGIGDESINAKIKEKVDYKANELSIFCLKMRELVEEQRKDIESKREYKHIMKQPCELVKMGRAAREKHLQKINSVCILVQKNKSQSSKSKSTIIESACIAIPTSSKIADEDQENMKPLSLRLS